MEYIFSTSDEELFACIDQIFLSRVIIEFLSLLLEIDPYQAEGSDAEDEKGSEDGREAYRNDVRVVERSPIS